MTKPFRQLQADLKKRKPFESSSQEAWLNLVRTTNQCQIHFERLFASFALTSSQDNILRILRGEGQPLPILEIAHRMVVVVPGITGLIDRLEKASFVMRERCTQDRRAIDIAITDTARQVLARNESPLRFGVTRLQKVRFARERGLASGETESRGLALPSGAWERGNGVAVEFGSLVW